MRQRQTRKSSVGLRRLGYGVGAVVLSVLLTGCSVSGLEPHLRFGWPTGVTKQAERMRVLWTWSTVLALFVGVIVWGLIFWCCIRYRKRDEEIPKQTKFNHGLEVVYSVIPLIICLGLFYYTYTAESYVEKLSKNPDTTIEVVAFQWNWQFNYCDRPYQGGGGTTDQVQCLDGGYVHTTGTASEIPILVVPKGQTVRIVEKSLDVVHSFWVPEFLFKRDVIPQPRNNEFEFTATSNGHYVGRCAELCGTYHSQMNFEVRVVEPDVYRQYLDALADFGPDDPAAQSKAMTEIGEPQYADTTYPFNTDRTARSASEK